MLAQLSAYPLLNSRCDVRMKGLLAEHFVHGRRSATGEHLAEHFLARTAIRRSHMGRSSVRLGNGRQIGRLLVLAIRSRRGIRRSGGSIPVQRQNHLFVNPATGDRLVVEQLLLDGFLPARQRFGRSGRATSLRCLRSFGTDAGRYLSDRFRHVTGRCRRDFFLRMPFPDSSEPRVAGRLLLRTLQRCVRTRPSGRRNGCLSLRAGMRLGDLASGKRLRKQNRFIQPPELFQHQVPFESSGRPGCAPAFYQGAKALHVVDQFPYIHRYSVKFSSVRLRTAAGARRPLSARPSYPPAAEIYEQNFFKVRIYTGLIQIPGRRPVRPAPFPNFGRKAPGKQKSNRSIQKTQEKIAFYTRIAYFWKTNRRFRHTANGRSFCKLIQ